MERQIWQVPDQQVPIWRHKLSDDGITSVFHENFKNCLSSQYLPCVKVSSQLHVPKWNYGAQVARWLIRQVPEWRHPAWSDVMTSDFDKNHRIHFSYQYLASVKVSSWSHHQKWSYCCFCFCIDCEICRNHVHLPRKDPPQILKYKTGGREIFTEWVK